MPFAYTTDRAKGGKGNWDGTPMADRSHAAPVVVVSPKRDTEGER
jgi:hypothetical protein